MKPAETARQEVPPRKTEEERAKLPERTDPKPLPPAPAPVLPDTRPQTIEAALAKIVRVDGHVSILAAGKKSPATAAQELRGSPGLQTGPASALVIEYPDGTQLELGSDTSIRELTDGPLGKRVELTRGVLSAVVAKQPEGRPLAISTPHGTATVLGTTLRIRVESLSTRLDVSEGNVLLKRTDGKSVEVLAGTYAVAAVGAELAARRILDGKEPVFIELEEFGTAREAKPTNGPTWKLYLETDPGASAGHLVVAPSAGTEVTGEMDFVKGRWYLWVRYRNEESAAPVTFQVLAGGKVIGQAATSPGGQNYLWKRFEFTASGPTRIGLRSTFKGVPDPALPLTPFDAVNRWDRICLVRDEDFIPK